MEKELLQRTIATLAEYEVAMLQNSEKRFVLKKKRFDPTTIHYCFYGQTFGNSDCKSAIEFKKSLNLPLFECDYGFNSDFDIIDNLNLESQNGYLTALEVFLYSLWEDDQMEKVYKIVEQFAKWENNNQEEVPKNLFTF